MCREEKRFARYKDVGAYFTVEAAIVLPMVMWIILLLVYMMFFQYNRCLMEMDMGALALKGCSLQAEDNAALMVVLEEKISEIDENKYIAWNSSEITVRLNRGKVEVTRAGWLLYPFAGVGIEGIGNSWESEITYENKRLSPVSFVRLCRRIVGGN